MDDHGGATRESRGGDRRVSTFFCRDCEQYFQAEPSSADGECAPCPHCESVCYTVEFEESERRRLQDEDNVLSFFAGILQFATGGLLQLPSLGARHVSDLPPNPFARTPSRFSPSSQIGQLVRTYLRGNTLEEFDSDREIWEQYLSASGRDGAKDLLEDVNQLLDLPPGEAFDAVNALCPGEGQVFIYPRSELIAWLKELKAFLGQALRTDAC